MFFREAYAQGKKERPPFVPRDQSASEDESDPIPDELLCPICNDLMSDAVVIPCCGNSYCDDCKLSRAQDFDHSTLFFSRHLSSHPKRVVGKVEFFEGGEKE